MRITYLNPCGTLGGAETSLRELLASVRNGAPEWELSLVLGEDGPLAEIARGLDVRVVVLPFPHSLSQLGETGGARLGTLLSLLLAAGGTTRYAWKLAGLLRTLQPDIVHTNGLKMHLLGAWACPRTSSLVWHIHDYVGRRRLMSRLLRPFRRICSAAIANSKSVAADVHTLFPGLRVEPIYNAIDLRRFSPSGPTLDLDAVSGLPPAAPGTVRAGLVATFARWKGHKVFLEALARLPQETAVRGYIIGGPIYQTGGSQWSRAELEQECARLGLSGKVGFTGFQADIPAVMRSLDLVVHASTEPEPFGMVIIEGMACGRAVIASDSGGASELFTNGVNAASHSPGDAVGLAEQIWRLAERGQPRMRLGAAGRETAERLFHRHRLAKELLAFYCSVFGRYIQKGEAPPRLGYNPRVGCDESVDVFPVIPDFHRYDA